ncbi:MSHA biogenesis protein MshO [Photobacterium kishitanii]|uniref:PilW family protein n=1 Tax=Photobacterium kishitanii TaxID=318456 RepID=UPI000D17065B|nr:prepilin-type N-terminal cleavage/methylation domain-containing protein [Photobacterium kishitanii]PSU88641.1 MSHA biogenesis protein MshO [Photobacterium kishitanii]
MLSRRSQGFTLIELIMVIVVMAILTIGIGRFVSLGTEGYLQTRDREQLQSQARFAVERISRELRDAVPNSLEITSDGQCLAFKPIQYNGDYVNPSLTNIDVITGFITQTIAPQFQSDMILVINPHKAQDFDGVSDQAAKVKAINKGTESNQWQFELDGQHRFGSGSLAQRFYIYTHSVKFCIESNSLTRITINNSGIESQPILLAQYIDTNLSAFELDNAALARSALVAWQLTFTRNGETSRYNHTVQVMNAP